MVLHPEQATTGWGILKAASAMMRMTGYPAAIIAWMLASGEIETPGARCQELVDGLLDAEQRMTGLLSVEGSQVTIAEVLKGAGYATAYYGKWHLGETAEREPQMQGFDHWYGIHNTSLPVDPNFPGTDMEIIESQKVMEGKADNLDNILIAFLNSDLTAARIDPMDGAA